MKELIQKELENLWNKSDDVDIDKQLEIFDGLKSIVTKDDLPQIVSALQSEKSDFWIRELLAEIICDLDGYEFLLELFVALEKNFKEGHDNDGFCFFLTELASSNSIECKKKLENFLFTPDFKYKDNAKWLIEFCQN